ncbi:hypothetical protein [Bradyrhizobium sp. LM2.9]
MTGIELSIPDLLDICQRRWRSVTDVPAARIGGNADCATWG